MISTKDGVSDLKKCAALIRAKLNIEPGTLSRQEFIARAADALYIADFDRRQIETAFLTVLAKVFPPDTNG